MATNTQYVQFGVRHDRFLPLADSSNGREWAEQFINVIKELFSGSSAGFSNVAYVADGGAFATGTLTFTGAPTAAQTFEIGGATFTARDSGAEGDEFNIGATVTETAAAVAAAVNASTTETFTGMVYATSSAGVVTFTSTVPGNFGNLLTLTESLSNATVSGSGFLAGGTSNPAVKYTF